MKIAFTTRIVPPKVDCKVDIANTLPIHATGRYSMCVEIVWMDD